MRADAARNRARVLAAAERAMAAKGAAVSTEEVARQAGVGIGTVFRHFPTKEALLAAVLVERLARFAAEADELARTGDPRTALVEVLTRAVDAYADKHAIADALTAAGIDAQPLASSAGQALLRDARRAAGRRPAGRHRAARHRGRRPGRAAGRHAASRGTPGRRALADEPAARRRLLAVVIDGLRPQ